MKFIAVCVFGALLCSGVSAAASQREQARSTASASDCSPSPEETKAAALKVRETTTDPNRFIIALDTALGFDTGFLTQHPAVSISSSDALSVLVLFPYPTYRMALIDANRKRDPIDDVAMPVGVVVSVSPARIDAPDIIKVIVERDGKVMMPIVNLLKPTTLETRIGAKAVLHSGMLVFSCAAFAPGARVHVTAIPESGSNIERDMPGDTIGYYPKLAQQTAATLMKSSATDVEARLGKPGQIDGRRWTYTTTAGRLVVYFDDANEVNDVQPRMFDLSVFKR